MKYIKLYEDSTTPQIGQYAAGYSETALEPEKSLLPTLVGKITDIDQRGFYVITYPLVIYYKTSWWYFRKDQILAFGDTEEEVEFKITANKYNL